jgi:hypothetical protein
LSGLSKKASGAKCGIKKFLGHKSQKTKQARAANSNWSKKLAIVGLK